MTLEGSHVTSTHPLWHTRLVCIHTQISVREVKENSHTEYWSLDNTTTMNEANSSTRFNGWMWSMFATQTQVLPETRRGHGSLEEPGVIGGCEILRRDSGNQTLFLWKSRRYSNTRCNPDWPQLLIFLLLPLQHILLATDTRTSSIMNFLTSAGDSRLQTLTGCSGMVLLSSTSICNVSLTTPNIASCGAWVPYLPL